MKVIYDTQDLELEPKEGESLLETCLRNKIDIDHSCEGMASCGTCRVLITEGSQHLPDRNSLEQEMADDRQFAKNERLACQLQGLKNFSFKLPKDSN